MLRFRDISPEHQVELKAGYYPEDGCLYLNPWMKGVGWQLGRRKITGWTFELIAPLISHIAAILTMSVEKYVLKFFFEWRVDTALWPHNETAYENLGLGPYEELTLPDLSPETWRQMRELATWYDTALNGDYPPDPGSWRQEECDRFNQAAQNLLKQIRQELGAEFEVINQQPEMREDPDLDTYLKDPKGFKRQ